MAVNNSNDSRINTRSPYYLEAGRDAPEVVTIPDPVEDNTPPTVTITATNTTPTLGDTVTLTAVAEDTDGTIAAYLWGGTSTPQTTVSIDITNTDTVESQTYYVVVTDDDGDTANAQITIHWQEEPEIVETTSSTLQCGDVLNEANFTGSKEYTLDVGDKIGAVNVTFLTPEGGVNDIPVKFTAIWGSTTETTGYIGDSVYDDDLLDGDVPSGEINTSATEGTTNKGTGTSLTINKTAASPETISLLAFSVLGNDTYKFRLDCPDVLATPTEFSTITATSDGTTVQYTDVSGFTQTKNLDDGDVEVVSAQVGTPTVTSGAATIEEGGASFDLGTPDIDIDGDLEINFFVGASGGGEHGRFYGVVQNELKQSLLEFYGNDSAKYDSMVNVYDYQDTAAGQILPDLADRVANNPNDNAMRKPWRWVQETAATSGNKVLNVAVGGSGTSFYHKRSSLYSQFIGSFNTYDNLPLGSDDIFFHTHDIKNLKDFLDTATNYGDTTVLMFPVQEGNTQEATYRAYLTALENGTNGLTGKHFGINDRSEIKIVDGFDFYASNNDMRDSVLNAMRQLGFTV